MTDARPVPAVYTAIAAVMADMSREGIGKDRKNQQQGYNFRGIDDVYNALSGLLSRHGLVMLPTVESREQTEGTTKSGGALFYTVCRVRFDLVAASDGSMHSITTYGEAMDSADKSTNKAMSAAYKYAAMQAFCIPTEGDNDADAHTHEPAPRRQPEPRREAPRAAPPPAPAQPTAPPEADALLATLATRGWTRDAVTAFGVRGVGGLRKLAADTDPARGFPAQVINRIGKRIVEAQAAGVLSAIVEQYGEPGTWGNGDEPMKRLDAIKATIAAAGGAA